MHNYNYITLKSQISWRATSRGLLTSTEEQSWIYGFKRKVICPTNCSLFSHFYVDIYKVHYTLKYTKKRFVNNLYVIRLEAFSHLDIVWQIPVCNRQVDSTHRVSRLVSRNWAASLYRNAFTTYKWFRLQSPVLSICMVYIYFLIILVFNVLDKLFTFTLHAHCVATRETNSPPCQIRNRIYIILLYPFVGK